MHSHVLVVSICIVNMKFNEEFAEGKTIMLLDSVLKGSHKAIVIASISDIIDVRVFFSK